MLPDGNESAPLKVKPHITEVIRNNKMTDIKARDNFAPRLFITPPPPPHTQITFYMAERSLSTRLSLVVIRTLHTADH